MNKKLSLSILAVVAIVAIFLINNNKETAFEKKQKEYAAYLANHPYSKRKSLTRKELRAIPKKDRPDLAFEQDFLRTMDPTTKKLHQDRLIKALRYGKKVKREATLSKTAATNFNWESRGPKKVAGRVRALMFDPNDAADKRVFAGGVSGGIWKNEDITDENSAWSMVSPDMLNFAISALDYDPIQTNTFYVGTGEGWGNVDAVNGAGIWKTTDGGVTWNNLISTINFEYVYDLIVRNEGGTEGVIYAAMRDVEDILSDGTDLFRSVDGGITWTVASTEAIRDLELGSDNTIWAGDASGSIFSSSNGVVFASKYTATLSSLGRVELATAKSNADVVYALITSGNKLGEIVKTTNSGTTWENVTEPSDSGDSTVPNDDFTRNQAWYDLIININPANENEIYVGGINTFRSLDAGFSWNKTSSWELSVDASVSYVHADIHNIIFRPNHNELLVASDGGIFYAPDNTKIQNNNGFVPRNLNFNITQFYSAAIDPINVDGFMGGAQDNGTNYIYEPGVSNSFEILGGDGGFSFIDQTANDGVDGIYYIASTQNNVSYLYDYSKPEVDYITLINNNESGSFINSSDYDDDNNIFYSYDGPNNITRAKLKPDYEDQGNRSNFSGEKDVVSSFQFSGAVVSHIRVSPHNKENRQVFFGTNIGRVLRMNANTDSFTRLNTTGVAGSISCIEIGATDDEVLLTYSNYGVKSVWYTIDGGTTWTDVEGNLPDIPVRWSLFNPLDRKEVIVATEAGIWKTSDVTAANVLWEPANSGMGNVRVDMLQYRASDNLVLAATHGRGLFTGKFTTVTASVEDVLRNNKAFTVFPTVSKGNFTVFAKSSLGKAKMNIFDISGRQVYKANLDFSTNEKQVVSLNVNSGIYIVNLVDENGKKDSKKIIIE
ncbi:T9SS type A sorting domain-containing protein [Polaribacter sp. IC073]|uniref:T9SS type A sorting domain-containing protein n=1 Tax=Polaribacter sp. IC073 TaxID=2508540 RepID=UPI0011BD5433|nr:T9SS type A sorting domain-containing protein [Polaribacter sp. IC073]TXD49837.1 T9SS type A sorting domain-containing protein [Polaribacter sp. IC073]